MTYLKNLTNIILETLCTKLYNKLVNTKSITIFESLNQSRRDLIKTVVRNTK